ncbi:MarC family protein [Nitrosococcus wardiae]|uniref:UPF0056 membrane protein n=1 Tax=Nitrosococcus wardiae TaxID=1814290 RepID=A0A4P7C5Z8_9GAMM|nr:MarC family protein [Nitrosococcus wardiae]QBQ56312.1 MarC family protein [Nitrosococcus wardiae]
MNWELLGNFFAALIGVLNPIGKIAVWSELTRALPGSVRLRLAFWNCMIAGGLLLFFLWAGKSILSFFGIQLPAFQLGGGILLFMTAISLFHGKVTEELHTKQAEEPELSSSSSKTPTFFQRMFFWMASSLRGNKIHAEKKERVRRSPELEARRQLPRIVVPMAVPLLAGPGTLTTVLLFGLMAQDRDESLQLSGMLLLSLFFVLGLLSAGPWLERYIGQPLLIAFTRIFALLLAGIAAQLILEGLAPILQGQD